MSEPCRVGTGPVRHTGGSMSVLKHAEVLAAELGCEANLTEVHHHMHTTKSDQTKYVDERSRKTTELFEERMQAATQTVKGSTRSTPVHTNQVFIALEGMKKQHIYKLGTVCSAYVASQAASSRRTGGASSS
ncbi:uncharacterized protein LOC126657016 [Mercurialis annua]|uniref:uncharacterized protein LOC126657016 n=1 Tax=Mercurialis annua TaxID=3986 RepID=UPI002160EDFF|nr:uncharacterized protein LOC126657016 [Mercurialis annua]